MSDLTETTKTTIDGTQFVSEKFIKQHIAGIFRPFTHSLDGSKRVYFARFIRRGINHQYNNNESVDGVSRIISADKNIWLDTELFNYIHCSREDSALNLLRLYKEYVNKFGLLAKNRDSQLNYNGITLGIFICVDKLNQCIITENWGEIEGVVTTLITLFQEYTTNKERMIVFLELLEEYLMDSNKKLTAKTIIDECIIEDDGLKSLISSDEFMNNTMVSVGGMKIAIGLQIGRLNLMSFAGYYDNLVKVYNTPTSEGSKAFKELSIVGYYLK